MAVRVASSALTELLTCSYEPSGRIDKRYTFFLFASRASKLEAILMDDRPCSVHCTFFP
jgi:hypothetical protein